MSRYNQSLRNKIQKLLNETDINLEEYTYVGVDEDEWGSVWLYKEKPKIKDLGPGLKELSSTKGMQHLGDLGGELPLSIFHIGEFDLSKGANPEHKYYYITYKAATSGRQVYGYVIHRTTMPFFSRQNVIKQICEDENVHKVILQNWIELTQEQFEIFDSEVEG